MGSKSRQKGKRGEREAVKVARDLLYAENAWRTAQVMGKDGGMADVQDVLDGFHVEVKRYARVSLYTWLDQAIRDMEPDQRPLLMIRGDKREWLFCIRADDIQDFVDAYLENKAASGRPRGDPAAFGLPDAADGQPGVPRAVRHKPHQ